MQRGNNVGSDVYGAVLKYDGSWQLGNHSLAFNSGLEWHTREHQSVINNPKVYSDIGDTSCDHPLQCVANLGLFKHLEGVMIKKIILSVFVLALFQTGHAHEFKSQKFHVDHPWARPTFALATTGAAYLSIHNIGGDDDRLTGASVNKEIADEVQLHDVLMDGDMMRMRQITSGVAIANDEMVSFTPGGKHIMLVGLKGPLNEGETFPMTLYFEKSEAIEVIVKVEKPSQEPNPHAQHH